MSPVGELRSHFSGMGTSPNYTVKPKFFEYFEFFLQYLRQGYQIIGGTGCHRLIFLNWFAIGFSLKQQTHRHPDAMQRVFRLRRVFLRHGYQSDGGNGLSVAVSLLSLRTIDLSSWTITVSYFGIRYSWLPTYLQYLHRYLYSL
jgi:hypothetical protein